MRRCVLRLWVSLPLLLLLSLWLWLLLMLLLLSPSRLGPSGGPILDHLHFQNEVRDGRTKRRVQDFRRRRRRTIRMNDVGSAHGGLELVAAAVVVLVVVLVVTLVRHSRTHGRLERINEHDQIERCCNHRCACVRRLRSLPHMNV